MTTYPSREELEEALHLAGGPDLAQLEAMARHMDERINRNEQLLRLTDKYKVKWNERRRVGNYAIEPFEVSEKESLAQMMVEINRPHARCVAPGQYTRLVEFRNESEFGVVVNDEWGRRRGTPEYARVWMSDTQAEVAEHLEAIAQTAVHRGDCLITGLGIGMVANAMLMEGADSVTVIESNEDIIELVAPLLHERWGRKRVRVVHRDAMLGALELVRGHWSVVWHDIWPTISSRNLPGMAELTAMYESDCLWQGCWNEDLCREMKELEDKSELIDIGSKILGRLPHLAGNLEGWKR